MAASINYVEKLKQYRNANVPLLIFGGPGIGKSEICKAAADGDEVKDVRLSMLEPVDMRGMPVVNRKGDGSEFSVEWAKPDFLPKDGKGIILFDELNTADPSVQNAALQFILDRRCGPHKLGDGWWIVACGNKSSHKAHVNPLSAPLRNRFVILEMQPDFNQWRNWAMNNLIHENVLGFMSSTSGQHLYSDPQDEYGNFPTPRGWTMVSRLLRNNITEREAIEGAIGKGAANWFIQYCNEIKVMPDIDALLDGKATYQDGPNKLSVTYAVVSNILYRALRNPNLIDKGANVMMSIRPEISSLYFGGLLQQKNEKFMLAVMKSTNAKNWLSKHRSLLVPFEVE
jgi:hypothetical protein